MGFDVYRGVLPNFDVRFVAISQDTEIANPEDCFKLGTTDITKEGEIEITGDTYLLDEVFTLR